MCVFCAQNTRFFPGKEKRENVTYLSCNNNDLQQLQDQLERFAAFGVIFIARAHEEIF